MSSFTLKKRLLTQEQQNALAFPIQTIRDEFGSEISPDGLHERFGYILSGNQWLAVRDRAWVKYLAPDSGWLDLLAWAEELGVPVAAFTSLSLDDRTTTSNIYLKAIKKHLDG
jgi:hypothetical protein